MEGKRCVDGDVKSVNKTRGVEEERGVVTFSEHGGRVRARCASSYTLRTQCAGRGVLCAGGGGGVAVMVPLSPLERPRCARGV